MPKAHFIGIGGIGISALARYYKSIGYEVSGSDLYDSELIKKLNQEGIRVSIGENEDFLPQDVDLIVYSEAIITKPDLSYEENLKANKELALGLKLGIKALSYPKALGEVVNKKKLIAITGTHGKSTTTSMVSIMLQEISSAIVGTQLKDFGGSNFHFSTGDYFTIEACEYKRSFLAYEPEILVVTNIDIDHLDYYKDLDDYVLAFRQIQGQTKGYVILNGDYPNSQKLKDSTKKQIWVYENYFEKDGEKTYFPKFDLQIPGTHIEFDAKLAFVVGKIVGLEDDFIVDRLNSYSGAWRRSEIIKMTENGNILMSDYGHHPLEIRLTLEAIKGKYSDKKLFVVFQPHQYSRTIKLLEEFKTCFGSADFLIIPNIYFSRDSKSDVEYMTTERFVSELKSNYPEVINGNGLENTVKFIKDFDAKNPDSSVILILGAGNVDEMRYEMN
ncbi:MAG: Mur ligase family protein [Candidatus Gracilibacteria bacterium]|nr:Mur ligase family protein [Candidatus Gracilibacteria bacterium]